MYRVNPAPEWNINPHLLVFMQHHPFLAGISRQIRKRCTRSITTAAVSYDVKTSEVVLWYNDLFMASLTNSMVYGVLKHEFFHMVFRHLTARRRDPCGRWNTATDMAIDWLIWHEAQLENRVKSCDELDPAQYPLPGFAKTPGRFPELFCPKTFRVRPLHMSEVAAKAIPLKRDDIHGMIADFDSSPSEFVNRQPTAAEQQAFRFATIIEAAPGNSTSEWYFNYLNQEMGTAPSEGETGSGGEAGQQDSGQGDEQGQEGKPTGSGASRASGSKHDPSSDGGSMDEHRNWDDIPDELRGKVENEIRSMVERAVREADSQANGWGHTPADICSMIRRSVSTCVDWKAVLRHFIGTIARGSTRRSITVWDRKYGLVQPGSTVGHTARLVVVIDQSGSVSSEMLAQFFAELEACTRKISVTILPFDSECRIEDAWEWRKGERPDLNRVKCGGTNFNAPTHVINEHARRKGWEGAVFMTDGECFKPDPCSVKRAWILGAGCGVPPWLDDETVIQMDQSMVATGAWR